MKQAKKNNLRLAVLDIDGTLTGHDGQVSQTNRLAVRRLRDRGLEVVLASGRNQANMMPYHAALDLSTPLVSVNGAVVAEPAGLVRSAICLPADSVQRLTLEGHASNLAVLHYRPEGVLLERPNAQTRYDETRGVQPHTRVDNLLVRPDGVLKVIWVGSPDLVDAQTVRAGQTFSSQAAIYPTEPGYLEFVASRVSKAAGLQLLVAEMGLSASQVIAFGDGNNDVQMLDWAGLGVAMGHASPAARAAANVVGPEGPVDTALSRAIEMVFEANREELVA